MKARVDTIGDEAAVHTTGVHSGVEMVRTPLVIATTVDDVIARLRTIAPATVVLDAEPLVVRWGARDSSAFQAAVGGIMERIANVTSVRAIVVATNAWTPFPVAIDQYDDVVVSVVNRAGKPWRLDYLEHLPVPIAVVGDQVLTDGLLAYRLNATFIHVPAVGAQPPLPRVQRIAGRVVRPALFAVASSLERPEDLRARHAATRPANSSLARNERLQVLLTDYSMCREDERSLTSAQVAVFSVGVTLLGLLAAAITQTCPFVTDAKQITGDCLRVPDIVLAVAPLLPLAVLALLMLYGMVATVRSYYLRALEHELRQFAPDALVSLRDVTPASYMGIATELMTMRRGRRPYRVLGNVIFLIVLVVLVTVVVNIGAHVDRPYQIGMAVVYGAATMLLLKDVSIATIGGRQLFRTTARLFLANPARKQVPSNVTDEGRAVEGERSLVSYLLMPRPEDIVKWLIAPGAFFAARWSTGVEAIAPFVWTWFTIEYLVYEARYQWNDVRGLADDVLHTERRSRGRLPVGPGGKDARRNALISLTVAIGRLAAAAGVAMWTGVLGPVASATGAILCVALAYEMLRGAASAGRHGLRTTDVAIWLIVGVGYAIRAAIGLGLGGMALRTPTAALGISFFFAFGCMFVLMTWVLEAASYCQVVGNDRLRWFAEKPLDAKHHLLALLWNANLLIEPDPPSSPGAYGGKYRILRDIRGIRSPWGLALVVAGALAAPFGLHLANGEPRHRLHVTVVSITATVMLASAGRLRSRALVMLLGIGVMIPALASTDVQSPAVAALPYVVVVLTYTWFSAQSYHDLKRAARLIEDVPVLLAAARARAFRLAVGRSTYQFIDREHSSET